MNKIRLLYFLFLALFVASCSNTKHLSEGELLYTGAKVKMEGNETSKKERKALKAELEKLVRPKPNTPFLGMRAKLFFYNLAGKPKKEKGWRHWMKTKVGEPPVVFSQVDLEYNRSVLQNYAENNGYFNTQSSADSTRKGKTATAEYSVKPEKQYKIKEVKFPTDSSEISNCHSQYQPQEFIKKRTWIQP